MAKYFHYTTQDHIRSIRDSGLIKTTESNVSMEEDHAGPDVVWLFDKTLKVVPRMLYTKLYSQDNFLGWFPKCHVELEIELDKNEVLRADKFLKKHKADALWIEKLEKAGGLKFHTQYVITRDIKVEEIANARYREDLLKQRKHSFRDSAGNPVSPPRKRT